MATVSELDEIKNKASIRLREFRTRKSQETPKTQKRIFGGEKIIYQST